MTKFWSLNRLSTALVFDWTPAGYYRYSGSMLGFTSDRLLRQLPISAPFGFGKWVAASLIFFTSSRALAASVSPGPSEALFLTQLLLLLLVGRLLGEAMLRIG